MTRQALSGQALLSRCRAWLHRLVDDAAYDEWELDTAPPSPEPDDRRSPQDLFDEVLRDAEHHAPRPDGEDGADTAQPS